ncbi:tyrosine-protein phosphatase [Nocardioides sp.]|uniref:tyrosine-protein phosphatase n=1 Tax=Nocardioides sp. TaxID=35761 RepID=UPI002717B240|nr:tyrosine-protein phosphatase [Nocardioides sp.]MDO9457160.1 tyrosine-protein phosphatase [Nocardioides sp.]
MPADDARWGEEITRLASADNFRDVAGPGYTTAAGEPLRPGVLWRSNELQLLDEDAATLASLGITAVFDLRSGHEVEAHPDVAVPGTTWQHVEVGGIPPGAGAELPDAPAAVAAMLDVYRRFVTDPDARRSFGTLLASLATSSTPQLFHCTAGKDRTGWAAALVLRVAGVADAVVEADYLLTNERSADTRAKYLGLVAEHLGADRVPTFEPIMVADLAYLHAGLAQAVGSYGSVEGYLRDGLGLTDDLLVALRSRLLAG